MLVFRSLELRFGREKRLGRSAMHEKSSVSAVRTKGNRIDGWGLVCVI